MPAAQGYYWTRFSPLFSETWSGLVSSLGQAIYIEFLLDLPDCNESNFPVLLELPCAVYGYAARYFACRFTAEGLADRYVYLPVRQYRNGETVGDLSLPGWTLSDTREVTFPILHDVEFTFLLNGPRALKEGGSRAIYQHTEYRTNVVFDDPDRLFFSASSLPLTVRNPAFLRDICRVFWSFCGFYITTRALFLMSAQRYLGYGDSPIESLYPRVEAAVADTFYAELGIPFYHYEHLPAGQRCWFCGSDRNPRINREYFLSATVLEGKLLVAWSFYDTPSFDFLYSQHHNPRFPDVAGWKTESVDPTSGFYGSLASSVDHLALFSGVGVSLNFGKTYERTTRSIDDPVVFFARDMYGAHPSSIHPSPRSISVFGSPLQSFLPPEAGARVIANPDHPLSIPDTFLREPGFQEWTRTSSPDPPPYTSARGVTFGDRWGLLVCVNEPFLTEYPIVLPPDTGPWEWEPPGDPRPEPQPTPVPVPDPAPVPAPPPPVGPVPLPGYGPFPYDYGSAIPILNIPYSIDIPSGVYTAGTWRVHWTIVSSFGPGGVYIVVRTGGVNTVTTPTRNTPGIYTDTLAVTAAQLTNINAAAGGTLSGSFDILSLSCAGRFTLLELELS